MEQKTEKKPEKKKKPQHHVLARHRFYFCFLRFVGVIVGWVYGCHYQIFRGKRGQNYFILANHQTLLDPAILAMSFRAPVYFVAGETLFNNTLPSRFLRHCFAPIKKRKGEADVASIRSMVRVAREGGNVALFPEGNRTWADFPFYIDPAICSLIRMLKLPLLLYRFEGGYGVDPRWGRKRRKGSFRACVYRELSVEKIAAMSDEALYRTVIDGLTVADGESGFHYISEKRAEYLERLLFICPMCGQVSSLRSEGAQVHCDHCHLSVTYNEDLSLASENAEFPFKTLKEWYAYQLECIKSMNPKPGAAIYRDKKTVLYDKTGERRVKIAKGECVLTPETLRVCETEIPLSEICSVSVVGGRKLVFHAKDRFYILTGGDRFNAIKYAFTFNVLPTSIKNEKYYGLDI